MRESCVSLKIAFFLLIYCLYHYFLATSYRSLLFSCSDPVVFYILSSSFVFYISSSSFVFYILCLHRVFIVSSSSCVLSYNRCYGDSRCIERRQLEASVIRTSARKKCTCWPTSQERARWTQRQVPPRPKEPQEPQEPQRSK